MASLDILIPHYNDLDGFRLALTSVAAQTWTGRKRIVICDDGSPADIFGALADLVARTDDRIVLLRNPANRGRPYTRNVLLDAIESTHTAWLDADDAWYPGKIGAQFAALAESEAAEGKTPVWVTCNYQYRLSEKGLKKNKQSLAGDQMMSVLRGANLRAYLWTFLARSEDFRNVGYFDERLTRLQDLDFCIRFLTRRGKIIATTTSDPLCVYHKEYSGRNAVEIRECFELVFEKHRILYNRYGTNFVRERLFDMEMHAALFARRNGDRSRALKFAAKAFLRSPGRYVQTAFARKP